MRIEKMKTEDFVELVVGYQIDGCDDKDIRELTDDQREIVALAACDTANVAYENMEQNSTLRAYFADFMNATFPYGRCCLEIEGKSVNGVMYGDDEMFGLDYFYQYFLSDFGTLYKLKYNAARPDVNTGDLSDVDYDNFDSYEIV